MDLEKLKKLAQNIMNNLDNPGLITEYVGQIQEEGENLLTQHQALQVTATEHENNVKDRDKKITDLRDANHKLFLRVGHTDSKSSGVEAGAGAEAGADSKDEDLELTFESVIDDFLSE